MKNLAGIAQVAFIAVAASAVFCFVSAAQRDTQRLSCIPLCKLQPAYAGSNRIAPDFELPDIHGQRVRLSSYRGKTVFLNFWTKNCGPCLEEMPSVAELARVARSRSDMAVLTVSTDNGPDDVRDALASVLGADIPFPVLFDPELNVVRDRYGTRLFPETWIIDPEGIIRARFDGRRDWSAGIILELGEMVQRTRGCPVEFDRSHPTGRFAGICEDLDL